MKPLDLRAPKKLKESQILLVVGVTNKNIVNKNK
jgi:hypothetical protein